MLIVTIVAFAQYYRNHSCDIFTISVDSTDRTTVGRVRNGHGLSLKHVLSIGITSFCRAAGVGITTDPTMTGKEKKNESGYHVVGASILARPIRLTSVKMQKLRLRS